ncbi:MAG: hypothetical protein K2H86_06975 [Muribaculaceae bacterium]|nr:hypothetical protein [Muribaculaceae bacterium]
MKRNPLILEVTHFGTNYVIPQRGKAGSIGYDLTVPEDVLVPAHSRIAIPLNIAINLPYGIEAKIEPRSGLSLKGMEGHGTREVPNLLFGIIPFFWKTISGKMYWDCDVLVGKIDPGYTDNIHVILKNNDKEFTIRRGTRIAQMTFYRVLSPKFEIVDKLSCKSRGGGLGSSGTEQLPDNDLCPVVKTDKRISFHEFYAMQSPEERERLDKLYSPSQQNK